MRDEGRLHRVEPSDRRRALRSSRPRRRPGSRASARQALIRLPSTSTVQAPHWPRSQPFLVPVSSSRSRSRSRSVTRGSSRSTSRRTPLMVRLRARVILAPRRWNCRFGCRRRSPGGRLSVDLGARQRRRFGGGWVATLLYGGCLRFATRAREDDGTGGREGKSRATLGLGSQPGEAPRGRPGGIQHGRSRCQPGGGGADGRVGNWHALPALPYARGALQCRVSSRGRPTRRACGPAGRRPAAGGGPAPLAACQRRHDRDEEGHARRAGACGRQFEGTLCRLRGAADSRGRRS